MVSAMGRCMPQLEFRWTSWLRVLKAPTPPSGKPSPLKDDGGLTAWCAEASSSLSLPELSRKVRVTWNPRMQTTAGRAWWPDRSIELNPKLRDCEPEELWRTRQHSPREAHPAHGRLLRLLPEIQSRRLSRPLPADQTQARLNRLPFPLFWSSTQKSGGISPGFLENSGFARLWACKLPPFP